MSIAIEFFIKIQPDMFLNGSLGDWYIIKIFERMIFICTNPLKNHLLLLFWGIWVKTHFPCISPFTNFIEIIVQLLCRIILMWNNWEEWWDSPKIRFHQTNNLCKLGNSSSRIGPCGSPALNFFPFRCFPIQTNSMKPVW